MKYCEDCQLVFEGERCQRCGRQGRPPAADDVCFLSEQNGIMGGMLADVLEQNAIPFLQKGTMGAGLMMKAGPLGERYRFWVRFDDLGKARELADELFGASEE